MRIFIYFVIICEVLVGTWNLCRYIGFAGLIKKKHEINAKDGGIGKPNILIALPCLREQNIICKTLDYVCDLLDADANIEVIVITTQKEDFEKRQKEKLCGYLLSDIKNKTDESDFTKKYSEIFTQTEIREFADMFGNGETLEIIENTIKRKANLLEKTTYQCVEQFIKSDEKYSKIVLLDYPHENGMMSDQNVSFVR